MIGQLSNLAQASLGRLRRVCGAVRSAFRAGLHTLSAKFLLTIIPVIVISVVVLVGAKEWLAFSEECAELTKKLRVIAASQSLILAEPVAKKDVEATAMIVAAIISDPAVSGVVVTGKTGGILDSYGQFGPSADALKFRQSINWIDENGPVRVGEIEVTGNSSAVYEGLKERLFVEALVALLLVAVTVAVSHLTHKRTINEPLRRLLSAINNVDENTTPNSVEWAARDEMGQVVTAFNSMRGKQDDAQRRLRSVMAALMEANGSLDRRVSERTEILNEEIRERKQAEAEMRSARDEARNANHAKTQFLSNMSHELRTPLNAILGFSQLIETDEQHPLAEEQAQNIHEVMKAGQHLLELIEEILDLSRIEIGSLNLRLERTNTDDIIDECISLVSRQAGDRRVQIERGGIEAPAPWIIADRRRVKQVLVNLLTNAIKYNHELGEVRIELSSLDSGHLRISISDTGSGIAPEHLGSIFDPFFRSSMVSSTVDGVGIGLAIAKQLVETMNGTIGLESTLGVGSTFWIDLPIAEPTTAIASAV